MEVSNVASQWTHFMPCETVPIPRLIVPVINPSASEFRFEQSDTWGKKDFEVVEINKTLIKTTRRTVFEEKQGMKLSCCDVSGSIICCFFPIAFCIFMTKHNLQM